MRIEEVLLKEEQALTKRLRAVQTARTALTGVPKRKMSKAARAKISKAQRARWAKKKA